MNQSKQLKQKLEDHRAIKLTDLRPTHNPVFQKSEQERKLLKDLKKAFKKSQTI